MPAVRRLLLIATLALPLLAAGRISLYLAGGGDLIVSEYEVLEDRVRYYSVERAQWEEIPLELVDLERTQKEQARRERRLASMRRETEREKAAERKARTELHNVPIEDGVYFYLNDQAVPVRQAEIETQKSSKRGFLQAISPAPIIPGKRKLTIAGARSDFVVGEAKPIFYIRDPSLSNFTLVKTPLDKKDQRLVQVVNIVPQAEERLEQQETIEIFRKQLAPGVYRVWPVEPLEPGEYAIVDFVPGEESLRAWDFRYEPGAPLPSELPPHESEAEDGSAEPPSS